MSKVRHEAATSAVRIALITLEFQVARPAHAFAMPACVGTALGQFLSVSARVVPVDVLAATGLGRVRTATLRCVAVFLADPALAVIEELLLAARQRVHVTEVALVGRRLATARIAAAVTVPVAVVPRGPLNRRISVVRVALAAGQLIALREVPLSLSTGAGIDPTAATFGAVTVQILAHRLCAPVSEALQSPWQPVSEVATASRLKSTTRPTETGLECASAKVARRARALSAAPITASRPVPAARR